MVYPQISKLYFRTGALIFILSLISDAATQAVIPKLKDCGLRGKCTEENRKRQSEMTNHTFATKLCFCDEECQIYSDCCQEIAKFQDPGIRIKGIPQGLWKCHNISRTSSVYTVSECRDSSTSVGLLCSKKVNSEFYHYVLDIPVFSRKTSIYYANIYCAMCHDEMNNVGPPNLEISCSSSNFTKEEIMRNGAYMPGQRKWSFGKEWCEIGFSKINPDDARRCFPSISECPSSWTDENVANLCRSYSLIVSGQDKNYKNPHCSLCYGVKQITCREKDFRKTWPSLTMVMNFDWNFEYCKLPHKIWDALKGVCHDMPCEDESCTTKQEACFEEPSSDNDNGVDLVNFVSPKTTLEGYLTLGSLVISIICLFLHNVIYYLLPKLQNLPARILKYLSWSLMVAQTLYLLGLSPIIKTPFEVCQAIAILLHFFFLASFFWMNVMSIDIWQTFSHFSIRGNNKNTLRNYSIYAWGGSSLIVILALFADLTDTVPQQYRPFYAKFCNVCWFANRTALGLFLYLPISSLLFVNIVLFTVTVSWLHQRKTSPELVKQAYGRKECARLWLYMKLSTIMGLAWASGVVAALTKNSVCWCLYIIFNGLQGAFIFFMFDIKSNVLNLIFSKVHGKDIKKQPPMTNYDTATQTSRLSTSISSRLGGSKI